LKTENSSTTSPFFIVKIWFHEFEEQPEQWENISFLWNLNKQVRN